MATQPTNLPVPSESYRDLKFNAGKIDEFVTSVVDTYVDRFGNQHYTIEGLRWLAQQAIAAFGWIPVESFQNGATLTLPNEILKDTDSGEYYRWDGAIPKVVPAGSTPSSTGGVGVGAWIGVGDSALRSMLGLIDGESLIGGATYAQIRTSNLAGNQIKCLGRTSNRDGGEGWFFLDSSDTTTADDDGTVLIDAAGRRWKRSYDGAKKAVWFGVIPNGTDISSNLSNALNIGLGQVEVKDGQYNSYTKITLNPYNGGASYPVAGRVSSRVDLIGGSMHNTTFNTNGNDFIEAIYGGTVASQAVATFATWEKFNVYGPSTAAGVGLRITGAANFLLDRVSLTKLSTGAALTGFLSGDVKNCVFRACSLQGLYLATGGNSSVNAVTIENNRFYDHLNLGIFGKVGAGAHIVGNNFEHNGTTNGAAGQGGINLTVTEPMSVVTIDHNWFEGNSGESDVTITNASNGTITVNISGNIFIRGVGGNYCTNNLKFANSGATGRIRVVFGAGNEFYTFATDGYTPDPSRPFISGDGRVIYVGLENCVYNETTSKGYSVVGYCSQVISGNVNSSGALLAAPPRFTSSKVATGVYSIISYETLSNNTDSIMCVATARDANVIIQRAVAVSTVEVRVYTTNISGTATDGSFNFMITTSR